MPDPRVARTIDLVLEAGRALLLEQGLGAVTHLEVARRSGVGRRTVYRHWPGRTQLLHDVLASTESSGAPVTGDLRTDLLAHLEHLRRALVDGHLVQVVLALGERAAVEPEMRPLRDALTEQGCRPLREILRAGQAAGALRRPLDEDAALAALEGPIFHRALIRGERVGADVVRPVVDAFLERHASS